MLLSWPKPGRRCRQSGIGLIVYFFGARSCGQITTAVTMTTVAPGLPRLKFFDNPHSIYGAKVKVILDAKSILYESVDVHCGASDEEYKRISPMGKVPALVVTEPGRTKDLVLIESEVINEWLEDRFPESKRLLPCSPSLRAQARILSRFHDLYLESTLRKTYTQVEPSKRDPVIVSQAHAEFCQRLGQLEQLLLEADAHTAHEQPGSDASAHPGYCIGGCLSLADAGYGPTFLYADVILGALGHNIEYSTWPRVSRLRQALKGDAHVSKVLSSLDIEAQQWLKSKIG